MKDHPLIVELAKVQYDLTSLKARVSEIQRQIAALNLEPPTARLCGHCGMTFRGVAPLQEHLYNSHGGELPDHWRRAEELAEVSADG